MNDTHIPERGGLLLGIPGASCRIRIDGPTWRGAVAGTIGQLSIDDPQAGREILDIAVGMLKEAGRDIVLAPMDGDTWRAYRAVVESDGSPRFPLEPWSGPHDVQALEAAGFGIVGRYASSRAPIPEATDAAPAVEGVTIRSWDGTDAEGLLGRLFAMASSSFAEKDFYKDITRDEFLALYRPLLSSIDPRMVLFAFDTAGGLVGFLFGYPDPSSGAAVLKTYAATIRGVGRMLAQRFHDDAREMGRSSVVHALMHVDNVSLDRSAAHHGETFRRYAIYAKGHAE